MPMLDTIKIVRVQLVLLLVILSLYLLSQVGVIPESSELNAILMRYLEKYGLILLLLISFLENIAGLNVYFPGSIAILASATMTAGNLPVAIKVWFAILLGSLIAHQINYLIGKHFAFGETMELSSSGACEKSKASSIRWVLFLSTFWHPHFAAMTCMSAGAKGMQYGSFVLLYSTSNVLWYIVWGCLIYNVGALVNSSMDWFPIIIACIALWAIWDLRVLWNKRKR